VLWRGGVSGKNKIISFADFNNAMGALRHKKSSNENMARRYECRLPSLLRRHLDEGSDWKSFWNSWATKPHRTLASIARNNNLLQFLSKKRRLRGTVCGIQDAIGGMSHTAAAVSGGPEFEEENQ